MSRRRTATAFAALAAGVVVAAARSRRRRDRAPGEDPADPAGRLIGDVAAYDLGSRLLYGPIFRHVAREVAAVTPPGAAVLEVGCGPGHLAIRMARDHGLRVTASDLDPAMVARAAANVDRAFAPGDPVRPTIVVGDVAALPFASGSFDVAVSTFSMHHWADPAAGIAELHRVLRPGGRAFVWDLAARVRHLEGQSPDPAAVAAASPFGGAATLSRWPGLLPIVERVDLVRGADGPGGGDGLGGEGGGDGPGSDGGGHGTGGADGGARTGADGAAMGPPAG